MGLINRMVADADLEAVVGEICASIAENAPLTDPLRQADDRGTG